MPVFYGRSEPRSKGGGVSRLGRTGGEAKCAGVKGSDTTVETGHPSTRTLKKVQRSLNQLCKAESGHAPDNLTCMLKGYYSLGATTPAAFGLPGLSGSSDVLHQELRVREVEELLIRSTEPVSG